MPTTSSRRTVLRHGGLGVALATAGCLGGPPAERTVEMTDGLRFEPETATVARGGTVTWRNVGSVAHTVTAYGDAIPADGAYFASGGFDSESAARASVAEGLIPADGSYRHRFDVAGSYRYFCIPHEGRGMRGTVRVK